MDDIKSELISEKNKTDRILGYILSLEDIINARDQEIKIIKTNSRKLDVFINKYWEQLKECDCEHTHFWRFNYVSCIKCNWNWFYLEDNK